MIHTVETHMRKVVLYIAMSLDGYIADSDNTVDWIKGQDDSAENEDTYTPFFASVDTVIMGKRTYDKIATELSPDVWPYSGATTYVITHHTLSDRDDIRFTDAAPCHLVSQLKKEVGKDIWICGGADIFNQLLRENLIDTFHVAIIPVILGNGTRLFEAADTLIELRLTDTMNYNGIVETVYERKEPLDTVITPSENR